MQKMLFFLLSPSKALISTNAELFQKGKQVIVPPLMKHNLLSKIDSVTLP